MIDNKKIEEAARHNADKYRNYPTLSDEDRDKVSIGSFMDCAKWMQEELLKNLWHSASEKPLLRNGTCLVVYNSGRIDIFKISFVYEVLSNYGKDGMGWKCLCYISDLIPKKGGEQ